MEKQQVKIIPGKLAGKIDAVSSKSYLHRMLLCAAMSDGETVIVLNCRSRDVDATIGCVRALGAQVDVWEDRLVVRPVQGKLNRVGWSGNGLSKTPESQDRIRSVAEDKELFPVFDCDESGSTARFILPMAAAVCGGGTLIGRGRLPKRPFGAICTVMEENGCSFSSYSLPMTVTGSLKAGVYRIPANISSQYISALMMALPLVEGDSEIVFTTEVESEGYLDITESVMRDFGVELEKTEYGYRIQGGRRYHSPGEITAEGDWSNGAFWAAANALGCALEIGNLKTDSLQRDCRIREVAKRLFASEAESQNALSLERERRETGSLCTKESERAAGLSGEQLGEDIGDNRKLGFRMARHEEAGEIFALYKSVLGGEFCAWNDFYPGMEEVNHDLETDNLYVLTKEDKIIGAISIVPENELDEFSCWSDADGTEREIARVVIAKAFQGHGLCLEMVGRMMEVLRERGCKSLRLAAAKKNIPACKTYLKAGCVIVGQGEIFGDSYYMMEKRLDEELSEGPDERAERKSAEMQEEIVIDGADIPDIIPISAIMACGREGRTRFTNCGRLRLKESDRLMSAASTVNALGGRAFVDKDDLIVEGCGKLTGGTVDSFGDHRIVMSAAIGAVISTGEVIITNAQDVSKSYPGFFGDYVKLGGRAERSSQYGF